MEQRRELERAACIPQPVDLTGFNSRASLPYGLTVGHVQQSMVAFIDFLSVVNSALYTRQIERLESMFTPANFSSLVGEFQNSNIPKYCTTLAKNNYHNGHPDLVPRGSYTGDRAQHEAEGIEIKASRSLSGWQGHNAEDAWLMVFVFDSNRPVDVPVAGSARPFRFVAVVGAKLERSDWSEQPRGPASRRTATASVTRRGYAKMVTNWIYRAPGASLRQLDLEIGVE